MTKRNILFGALAILMIASAFFIVKTVSRHHERQERQAVVLDLLSLIPLNGAETDQQIIDVVQRFVHDNSDHRIDDEFRSLWRDQALHYSTFKDYIIGTRSTPVPMECSTRSSLMREILRNMGFKVRDLDIFNADNNLDAHSFLEVWDDGLGVWVSYDPDYNLYWVHKETSARSSFLDVMSDPDLYLPCSPQKCDWSVRSKAGARPEKLKNLMDIATIIDREHSERYTLFASHVPPERIYNINDETGSFCQVIQKNCKHGFFPIADYKRDQITQF